MPTVRDFFASGQPTVAAEQRGSAHLRDVGADSVSSKLRSRSPPHARRTLRRRPRAQQRAHVAHLAVEAAGFGARSLNHYANTLPLYGRNLGAGAAATNEPDALPRRARAAQQAARRVTPAKRGTGGLKRTDLAADSGRPSMPKQVAVIWAQSMKCVFGTEI